jgi:hypothetical protein
MTNSAVVKQVEYYPITFLHDDFDPRKYISDSTLTDDDISKACPDAPRDWMEIHESKAINKVTVAGRRGAKSTGWNAHTCIWEAAACPKDVIKRFQNSLSVAYIGPLLNQTKKIIWERMKYLCDPFAAKTNNTELEIKLINGMWIRLLGTDVDDKKLRGFPFWFVYFDEAAFQAARIFDEVLEPSLGDEDTVAAGGGRCGFGGTPFGQDENLYQKFQIAKADTTGRNWQAWRWASWQNPKCNRVRLALRYQRLKREGNLLKWKQENCAEFVSVAGAIYPTFKKDTHVRNFEIPEEWPMFLAIDNGADDPTAAVIGAVDYRGRIWVRHVYCQRDTAISGHCKAIDEILLPYGGIRSRRFKWKVMDRTNKQLFREYAQNGYHLSGASNTRDSVYPGICRMQEYMKLDAMGEPGIFFHEECEVAIKQHTMYRWKPSSNESMNAPNVPLKSDDHTCDALRYFVMMLPSAPKKQVFSTTSSLQERMQKDLARVRKAANTINVGKKRNHRRRRRY